MEGGGAPPKKRVGRPTVKHLDEDGEMLAGGQYGLGGAAGVAPGSEPLKLRRKRANSGAADEAAAVLASMLEPDEEEAAAAGGGGSIIKRRKKGELQILVPGAGGGGGAGAARGVAFDATVKGGAPPSRLTNMGPPLNQDGGASSQGGRRSTRGARGGPLSLSNGPLTMSNLGHFPLESPFGLTSDGLGRPVHSMFNLNSSRDMAGGGGLSSNMTDGMRFDFDEVVQVHHAPHRTCEQWD
jgi:hypothetical protein